MAKLHMIEDNHTGKVLSGYGANGNPLFNRLDDVRRVMIYRNKEDAMEVSHHLDEAFCMDTRVVVLKY
jgi:hypothetical protein